jgi:hypothetical protein
VSAFFCETTSIIRRMKTRRTAMLGALGLLALAVMTVLMNLAGVTTERPDDTADRATSVTKSSRPRGMERRAAHNEGRSDRHTEDAAGTEPSVATHGEAPVPIAFLVQEVDMNEFTSEENEIIHRVQKQFADELSGQVSENPGAEAYSKAWKKAQWRADNRLRLELGAVAFNRFNSLAAQQAELKRSMGRK